MRRKIIAMAFVLAGLSGFRGIADEPEDENDVPRVVISATRTEKPADEVSSTMSVFSSERIADEGEDSLEDILRSVPGVDVARTGGPGSEASVFIRGGRGEHTMVLVDGVEIHEPLNTVGSTNAAVISLGGIERIEVIRGPASPLYGSDALAGVVNIITRKGDGPPGAAAEVTGGSFNTLTESGEAWGHAWKVSWYAGVSNYSSDGISAADEEDGNDERDGFNITSATARLGIDPADWLELEVIFRGLESMTELDAFDYLLGVPVDDEDFETEYDMYLMSGAARVYLWDGRWRQSLVAAQVNHIREMLDERDDDHPFDSFDARYLSDSLQLTWQNDVDFTQNHRFTAGMDYREESGEYETEGSSVFGEYEDDFDREKSILQSVFAQWDYHRREAGLVAGVRSDHHDTFGSHNTYRVGGTYLLESTGTRLRASAGTGFKAPSIYQMYYTFIPGAPPPLGDLDPERSESWEAGVIQSLLDDRMRISATYFDVFYEDMIDWDSLTWTYVNVARARSMGWEIEINARPVDSLEVILAWSDVDARDRDTDEVLIRRDGEKYSGAVFWAPTRKSKVYLSAQHVGQREDLAFIMGVTERVELDPYTLVNAGGSYELLKGFEILVRGQNLLDEHYQEAYGYGMMPASYYAGVSYTYQSGSGY